MSFEEFALNWDDHHSTLVGVFEKLLETSTLVDCTIAADGQYLKAHKVVLSACSPYFEMLFVQENEKNPIVVLKDIKFQELRAIIDFVYRGKVKIPQERLVDFVEAAESLQIKGLGGECRRNVLAKSNSLGLALKRQACSSPIRSKHIRNTHAAFSETNIQSSSCGNDANEQISGCESLSALPLPPLSPTLQDQLKPTNSLTLSPGDANLSSLNGPDSPIPFANITQNEERRVDTKLLSSSVHSMLSNEEDCVPINAPEVKLEQERVSEVFLPEPVCLIEPKKEVCMEEISLLECEDDATEELTQDMPDQGSSSQYSDIPSIHETLQGRSDSLFLASQIAEVINMQGGGGGGCAALEAKARTQAQVGLLRTGAPRAARRSADPLWLPGKRLGVPGQGARHHRLHHHAAAASATPRRHACAFCHKAFVTPSLLERHMRTHTGERPYACRQCGFTFKELSHLKAHLRTHAHALRAAAM